MSRVEGVLGIDPSYTCTGLVILSPKLIVLSSSKVRLPPGTNRLLRAGKALDTFIRDTIGTHGPSSLKLAVVEDAAYAAPSRHVTAKLKELSGVYKFILEAHDIPWLELSPTSAKKNITGKGTSEKSIVARELFTTFGIQFEEDKGYDLSDAAALAVWGVRHYYGNDS